MDDNRVKAVVPDSPEVTKGSNFPTPMAMAPVQPPSDSNPQATPPQPITPVAEAPSQPQDAGTATGSPDASSQG